MKLNTIYYMHFFTLSLILMPCLAYGGSTLNTGRGIPRIAESGNVITNDPEHTDATGSTKNSTPNDTEQPADTSSVTKQPNPKLIPEYSDPIHFMSDFLDVNKKRDKPLKYWALQLVLLLKNDAKLIDFCRKIQKIALNKAPYDKPQDQDPKVRAKNINGAFLEAYMHQLFSREFSNFIIQKGLPTVREAIEKRAAVVSMPQEKA